MKKAQTSHQFVIGLIILLAVIALLLAFEGQLFSAVKGGAKKENCKRSVWAHAVGHISGTQLIFKNINCPTEEIIITKKETETEAKDRLAKAMYDCSDQFWQGKLELFKGEGTFCVICSRIEFEEKEGYISKFSDYLMTHNPPGEDVSYMDFLMGYETPKVRQYYDNPSLYNKNDPKLERQIDKSKLQSVIFVYGRGQDITNNLKELVGGQVAATAIGGGVGLAGGIALGFLVFGTGPVGWLAAGIAGLGIGFISAEKTFFAGEEPEWAALTVFREYNPAELDNLGCEKLPVQ